MRKKSCNQCVTYCVSKTDKSCVIVQQRKVGKETHQLSTVIGRRGQTVLFIFFLSEKFECFT